MHAFAGQEAVPASWWGYDGPAGPRARTRPSVREPMRWIRGLHKHNRLKTGIILLQGLRKHNRLKTAQAQPTENRDYSVAFRAAAAGRDARARMGDRLLLLDGADIAGRESDVIEADAVLLRIVMDVDA